MYIHITKKNSNHDLAVTIKLNLRNTLFEFIIFTLVMYLCLYYFYNSNIL